MRHSLICNKFTVYYCIFPATSLLSAKIDGRENSLFQKNKNLFRLHQYSKIRQSGYQTSKTLAKQSDLAGLKMYVSISIQDTSL